MAMQESLVGRLLARVYELDAELRFRDRLIDVESEGVVACLEGQSRAANPFPSASPEAQHWDLGWLEQDELLERDRRIAQLERQLDAASGARGQASPAFPH